MLVLLDPYQSENMLPFMKNRLLLKAPSLFPDVLCLFISLVTFYLPARQKKKKPSTGWLLKCGLDFSV